MQNPWKLRRTLRCGYASVGARSMLEGTVAKELQREFPEAPIVGVGAVVVDQGPRFAGAARARAVEREVVSARRDAGIGRVPDRWRCARSSGRNRPDRGIDRIDRAHRSCSKRRWSRGEANPVPLCNCRLSMPGRWWRLAGRFRRGRRALGGTSRMEQPQRVGA